MKTRLLSALAAIGVTACVAYAANIPLITGPQDPSQLNATINTLINSINTLITPQSMSTFRDNRNFIDNGGMDIQQRGTGAATCATTSGIVATSYAADRWACDVNVGSGAGQLTVITATPSPPTGFNASLKLNRNSGALTQQQCAWQELRTQDVVKLQGQPVILSFYAQALAGLAADNGNAITAVIITGTGTDQGLGGLRSAVGMTASPAITPAWTGIATLQAQAQTITTSWVRYTMPSVVVATTVNEMAVGLCFTPTATGAGATDGFAFTGVQLEQGTTASPFEFRNTSVEALVAQRYYWQITEPAASVSIGASGQGASTTTCILSIPLPTQMDIVPTAGFTGTALSGSTWTVTHVVTNTALSTPFLAATAGGSTKNALNLTATTGATLTAGQTCTLTGAGGGGILTASADF